jgi:hypothetical protein
VIAAICEFVISPSPPRAFPLPCPKCGVDVDRLKGLGRGRFETRPCGHVVRVDFDDARHVGRLVDDEA